MIILILDFRKKIIKDCLTPQTTLYSINFINSQKLKLFLNNIYCVEKVYGFIFLFSHSKKQLCDASAVLRISLINIYQYSVFTYLYLKDKNGYKHIPIRLKTKIIYTQLSTSLVAFFVYFPSERLLPIHTKQLRKNNK